MKLKHLKGAVSSTEVPKRKKYNHFGINYDNSRVQDNYTIIIIIKYFYLWVRIYSARFFETRASF